MLTLSRSNSAPQGGNTTQDRSAAWVGVAACAFVTGVTPGQSQDVDLLAPGPTVPTIRVSLSNATTTAAYDPEVTQPSLETSMPALVTEVLGLKRLEGWDGEGARPITKRTCQTTVSFLRHIAAQVPNAPRPFVSASPGGAVALRWTRGRQGLMVRVSGGPAGRVSYLIGGGGIQPEHGETDWTGITERLQTFLATD